MKTSTSSKRDELLDIASDLFYDQGYGATGIKQIIDTAGIAKGTFYSHFTSKDEVGLAWLKKRNQVWGEWLEEATGKAKAPKGKILVYFDVLKKWMEENDFRGCAFLNSMAELPDPTNPMRDEIAAHKQAMKEGIGMLAAEHYTGRPSGFANHKGLVIFLLLEGALIESQNFREIWPIATARKEVREMLSEN